MRPSTRRCSSAQTFPRNHIRKALAERFGSSQECDTDGNSPRAEELTHDSSHEANCGAPPGIYLRWPHGRTVGVDTSCTLRHRSIESLSLRVAPSHLGWARLCFPKRKIEATSDRVIRSLTEDVVGRRRQRISPESPGAQHGLPSMQVGNLLYSRGQRIRSDYLFRRKRKLVSVGARTQSRGCHGFSLTIRNAMPSSRHVPIASDTTIVKPMPQTQGCLTVRGTSLEEGGHGWKRAARKL